MECLVCSEGNIYIIPILPYLPTQEELHSLFHCSRPKDTWCLFMECENDRT